MGHLPYFQICPSYRYNESTTQHPGDHIIQGDALRFTQTSLKLPRILEHAPPVHLFAGQKLAEICEATEKAPTLFGVLDTTPFAHCLRAEWSQLTQRVVALGPTSRLQDHATELTFMTVLLDRMIWASMTYHSLSENSPHRHVVYRPSTSTGGWSQLRAVDHECRARELWIGFVEAYKGTHTVLPIAPLPLPSLSTCSGLSDDSAPHQAPVVLLSCGDGAYATSTLQASLSDTRIDQQLYAHAERAQQRTVLSVAEEHFGRAALAIRAVLAQRKGESLLQALLR